MKKIHWSIAKRIAKLKASPSVQKRMGAKWLLDHHDWIDLQLLIKRPYEIAQRKYFFDTCKQYNVTRFIDCGANFGLYSILATQQLSALQSIDCFEPVIETRYKLYANLWLNTLSSQINVHEYALSNRDESLVIAIDETSTGISTLDPKSDECKGRNFTAQQDVILKKLDDIVEYTSDVIALKIDVEGHEAELIEGALSTLKNNHCFLQIEMRTRNSKTINDMLNTLEYQKIHEIGDDVYFASSHLLK